MATNIPQQQLIAALTKIQKDFGLSDAQMKALSNLDDIKIEEQKDSDAISFNDLKNRTPHPFKLFIGRQLKVEDHEEWKDCFAYLLKNGKSAFQIFLTRLYPEHYWLAGTPDYFGSVKELSFPFIECLGGGRFVALVKFYFLLGHRVGLYPADPGHAVTKTWRKDLQGVCNDIAAEAEMTKAKQEKDRKERLERDNQQAPSRNTAQARPTRLPPPPPPQPSRKQSFKKPSVTPNTGAVHMEDGGGNEYEKRRDRAMPPPSFPPHEHGSRPRAPGNYQLPPYTPPLGYHQSPSSYGTMPFPPPIGFNPHTGRPYSAHPPVADDRFGSSERLRSRSSDHMPPPGRPERPTASRSQNSSASRHSTNRPRSHPIVMLNNLDQAALDAERAGVYLPSSLAAAQLVEEYERLYQQREYIKTRMDAITAQLPFAHRHAMVRRLEDMQLPTLKRPSGPGN